MLPHLGKKPCMWLDDRPAKNIDQIYSSCLTRLNQIKQTLDNLDYEYKINDSHLLETMNKYSSSLSRLRFLIGISDFKSSKSIKDSIKILRNNIEYFKFEKQKEFHSKMLNKAPSFELFDFDEFKDGEQVDDDGFNVKKSSQTSQIDQEETFEERNIQNDLKTALNFTSTINYVLKKRQESEKEVKNQDALITPMLTALRRNLIKIDPINEQDLEILVHLSEQTLEAIKYKYSDLINQIEHIGLICDKYLSSFLDESLQDVLKKNNQTKKEFNLDENSSQYLTLLDTVIKYENKNDFYANFVRKSIKSLRNLMKSYDDGTSNGVSLKMFNDYSLKLCKRFDLDNLQFVLIIPENSSVLNQCVKYLKEWIEYDKEYSYLIQQDMKQIDKQRKYLYSLKLSCEGLYNQLIYRIEILRNNLDELNSHSAKKESIRLENEKHFKYSNLECKLMLEKINLDLNEIENEIFKLSRKFQEDKFYELKVNLINLKRELLSLYAEKKVNQNDLVLLDKSHFKLKQILIYKTCSETLEKIYYNIQLPVLKFGYNSSESSVELNLKDSFLNAFVIISELIGTDWIKLYFSLPFYPERGKENIQKDINEVYLRFNRAKSEKEQAYSSLVKWKRLNSRAKLEDLRDSLKKIGRNDIVRDLLNSDLNKEFSRKELRSKKSTLDELDLKKQEAELLHQKLTKFFDKSKIKKSNQFNFKLCTTNKEF